VHGSELAVAWLARGHDSRARGIVRPLNGGSSGRIVELGSVLEPLSVPRGNLAVTNRDGHFAVLSRGRQSDCIEPSAHDCVSLVATPSGESVTLKSYQCDSTLLREVVLPGLPLGSPR
jgi:hypothetical protein